MNELAGQGIDFYPNISKDVTAYVQTLKNQYPVRSNRASGLGDLCLRRLVYGRTIWEKAKPVNDYLQGIFKTGTELETVINRQVIGPAGDNASPRWRMVGGQSEIIDKTFAEYEITGHPDGELQVEIESDRWTGFGPGDIKTCSKFTYAAINCVADLDKLFFTKKWKSQVNLYTFGMNQEQGALILVAKENLFNVKVIRIPLDLGHVEGLLKKAENINKHVKAGTLPDRICNAKECLNCCFAHECCPDLEAIGNLKIIEDDELLELLRAREEFTEHYKLYNKADKALKDSLVGGQDVMVGDFLIQWQEITKTTKPSAGGTMSYFKKNISRQGGTDDED